MAIIMTLFRLCRRGMSTSEMDVVGTIHGLGWVVGWCKMDPCPSLVHLLRKWNRWGTSRRGTCPPIYIRVYKRPVPRWSSITKRRSKQNVYVSTWYAVPLPPPKWWKTASGNGKATVAYHCPLLAVLDGLGWRGTVKLNSYTQGPLNSI